MPLSNGKWEVKDPAGLTHVIEVVKGEIHGTENLTHFEMQHNRALFLTHILLNIENSPEQGEWGNYAWQRRS
jgi:hypothetical protein